MSRTPSLPSNSVMESLDRLFDGPAAADAQPGQLVHDPVELADRNQMFEKGFDGRGVIPIQAPSRKPDLAYRLFVKKLGDDDNHTQLKSALSTIDTVAANRALAMLFNPRHRRTKIETLLKRAGIGIPQLRDIWRQAKLDDGMLALLNAYPAAMKDVARDARSTREACQFCAGAGRVVDDTKPKRKARGTPDPIPVFTSCHSCRGRGWVRKTGDKDARALMGQIIGVSGKQSPLISSTTNVFNLESVIGDIEQLQRTRGGNALGGGGGGSGIYEVTAEPADPVDDLAESVGDVGDGS